MANKTYSSLNLGSGEDTSGDVTFDIVALPEVDVQGDMHRLPFATDTFDRVELTHVLEHASDPISVLEEIHRVCRDGATVHIVVPHGFTIRGIRDPTHKQYYSLRSIEHFCTDQSYLPGWYSSATFRLQERAIVPGPPNEIEPVGSVGALVRVAAKGATRVIARAANWMPEVFEPFVALTPRADITWTIQVEKNSGE